jgi:hypothetical protein
MACLSLFFVSFFSAPPKHFWKKWFAYIQGQFMADEATSRELQNKIHSLARSFASSLGGFNVD